MPVVQILLRLFKVDREPQPWLAVRHRGRLKKPRLSNWRETMLAQPHPMISQIVFRAMTAALLGGITTAIGMEGAPAFSCRAVSRPAP